MVVRVATTAPVIFSSTEDQLRVMSVGCSLTSFICTSKDWVKLNPWESVTVISKFKTGVDS